MRRGGGFTLIELLVALAIFAMLASVAYTALSTVMRARDHTAQRTERLIELQTAFTFLMRDLEQAVQRPVRDDFGDTEAALSGGNLVGSQLLAVTHTGWRNPLGLARSHLQRVAYALEHEELIRRSWSTLDRTSGSEPYDDVLLSGVKSMELRFLGADTQWLNFWPPPATNDSETDANAASLPRAVEITVDTADYGRLTRLLRVTG